METRPVAAVTQVSDLAPLSGNSGPVWRRSCDPPPGRTDSREPSGRSLAALGITAALALAPALAQAQVTALNNATGGGAFLQGIFTWVQQNAITTIAAFAIMGIGGAMAFLHFHLKNIVITCSGIWIAFNALQLAGVVPH